MSDDFRLKNWLVSALRSVFRRYPPYGRTLNKVKEEYFITTKNGKQLRRVKFKCASCGEWFSRKQIQVDHISGVTGEKGFPTLPDGSSDWNTYIANMFVSDDGLQVLCKDKCHKEKTKQERGVQAAYRKSIDKS